MIKVDGKMGGEKMAFWFLKIIIFSFPHPQVHYVKDY